MSGDTSHKYPSELKLLLGVGTPATVQKWCRHTDHHAHTGPQQQLELSNQ